MRASMSGTDYTGFILDWLMDAHEMEDENAAFALIAGLQWGVALAARHPEYAADAHAELGKDYRTRLGGNEMLFEMMAAGDGDTRTSPEKLADELVESCPLGPDKT